MTTKSTYEESTWDGCLTVSGSVEGQTLHLTRRWNNLIQHKFLRADLYGASEDGVRIAVQSDLEFLKDYLSWKC